MEPQEEAGAQEEEPQVEEPQGQEPQGEEPQEKESKEEEPPPATMRVKELKAELDTRGVSWRGVAFEKEELVRLLEDARARPASMPTSPAPPSPSPATAAPPASDDMNVVGGETKKMPKKDASAAGQGMPSGMGGFPGGMGGFPGGMGGFPGGMGGFP